MREGPLTFARELFRGRGLPPLLLLETFAASRALRSAGVVLTSAEKLFRQFPVQHVARVRVPVAHATAADTDVFYRVEVLEPKGFYVLLSLCEMNISFCTKI